MANFDEYFLATAYLNQTAIFSDPRNSRNLEAHAEALIAVLENQAVNIAPVQNAVLNRNARKTGPDLYVRWPDYTMIGTEICAVTCTPTGVPLDSGFAPITLAECRQATPFAINPEDFRGSDADLEELVATAQLKQRKELDEFLSLTALNKIIALSGANKDTSGMYGADITVDSTYIAPAQAGGDWGWDIFGHFALTAQMNKIRNPYYIHGNNFWSLAWNSQFAPADGAQNAAYDRMRSMRHNWAVENFIEVGRQNLSLMIDGPSLAFVSVNYNGQPAPQASLNTAGYQTNPDGSLSGYVPSLVLPQTFYDVEVTRKCEVVNGRKTWPYVFEMRVPKFDVIMNPENSEAGYPSVLEIYRGTRPAPAV